jgi:N-dimethylarginine dimethylaminohydrolase
MTPVINSHNSWSQLEEVWLGDVYPASWYEHLDSEVRDVFQTLTEITQQDLNSIQHTLEKMGVTVQRPEYKDIDNFVYNNGQLLKPSITPRDEYVVIGNTLYTPKFPQPQWAHVLKNYRKDSASSVKTGHSAFICGANVVRVGRDLIIDIGYAPDAYQGIDLNNNEYQDYRVKIVENGGHLDGCFATLKPGLILANHYFDDYERTFPGWEIIMLDNPTYNAAPSRGNFQKYPVQNGKFWDTGVGTNYMFNEHVVKHALDWVGMYTETYFELNCLVINESNVVMLAENEILARDLERHGITVHWVPFRARSFWDGGVHCLTVDIRRQSTIEDFFPERNQ